NRRTFQHGHVTFADQRPSYGGSFASACVAQSSPSTSRSKQLLYNRLHLLEGSLSQFSISHVQSSSTSISACSVTSDLLSSGTPDATIRTISIVSSDKDCFKPLLGESSSARVTGFPFSASYFDAQNAYLGSEMRLKGNCLISQGDKENYVYPVNVTANGRVCLSTGSAGNMRDYKNYCISTVRQSGLRLLVGNVWEVSLGDAAYSGWSQCGALEVPQLSSEYSIACDAGGLPYRFLALIRRVELGSLNITSLMVYGKECELDAE
uniref:DDE Tnp4 domain-containing protein n=1 Tax=Macrostomum lignano TaxID=282301 RepID=A0A1I8GE34_9PLAT